MADDIDNWSPDTDVAAVREIVRLGEAQMGDILTIALAGDQRANTLAYTLATVAAGLMVGAITLLNLKQVPVLAVVAALSSASIFLIAAGCAMLAAKPTDFYNRGFRPVALIGRGGDELQILKWAAEDLDKKISNNRDAQNASAALTEWAHWIAFTAAVAAPVSAMTAWLAGY